MTTEVTATTVVEEFEPVGEGLTVFESAEPVLGRAKWLDGPDDVIAFVESGEDVSDVIVIARGGTTTFLSMALNAGVRGILTLQGAPESHLGILSREYGIPCIMSVAFQRGMRTSRGEVVPADGALLSMDVSSRPVGTVFMESGAPVDDSPVEPDVPALSAEQQAQIQEMLTNFRGEIPHGAEGDAQMQQSLSSNVLDLSDPEYDRELTATETTDILRYLAWCVWDALAARATEGESGLIPRQEYEALGFMDSWFHHPLWLQRIRDRVGDAGLVEIGARARTEIGTKINLLHMWAAGTALSEGRAAALELNLHEFEYRADDIPAAMTATRLLYQGIWGSGPMFASMREYRAPVLDRAWIDRFQEDRIVFDSDAARSTFQRFNGALELLGFLIHFDNRLGLGDSGPYPTDDGGFVIVRDLFINEPAYEWSSTTDGLPYAVTIAMFFDGGMDLRTKVQDLSTMFTEPANYLPYVTGVSVYAREKFDTPMSELRTLTLDDMDQMRTRGEVSSSALYKRIAAMSHDEKVRAGAVVYASGFLLPFVRAAGMYDELVAEHGFMALHPVPLASYETIIDGVAGEMIPRFFLTGSWANDVPETGSATTAARDGEFAVLHALGVRGFATPAQLTASTGLSNETVEAVLSAAVEAGWAELLTGRLAGARLTPVGRSRRLLLLHQGTGAVEQSALSGAYDAFLAPNRAFKALTTRWQTDKDLDAVLAGLDGIHSDVTQILGDAAAVSPRFGIYQSRLDDAVRRFRGGDEDALSKPMAESYHDIWMELHEDLLVSLGLERGSDDE